MALKFRLRGLAETFIDELTCPNCRYCSDSENDFKTDDTKITESGIIIVAECNFCGEIFVPENQKVGVINPKLLSSALVTESVVKKLPPLKSFNDVKLKIEQMNAVRRGDLH